MSLEGVPLTGRRYPPIPWPPNPALRAGVAEGSRIAFGGMVLEVTKVDGHTVHAKTLPQCPLCDTIVESVTHGWRLMPEPQDPRVHGVTGANVRDLSTLRPCGCRIPPVMAEGIERQL